MSMTHALNSDARADRAFPSETGAADPQKHLATPRARSALAGIPLRIGDEGAATMHDAMPANGAPIIDEDPPANNPHGGYAGPTTDAFDSKAQVATDTETLSYPSLLSRANDAGISLFKQFPLDPSFGDVVYIAARRTVIKEFRTLGEVDAWSSGKSGGRRG
jgi:hypothetical protein